MEMIFEILIYSLLCDSSPMMMKLLLKSILKFQSYD